MTETVLRRLASTYAAGEIGFSEYRRRRARFIDGLTGEAGQSAVSADLLAPDEEESHKAGEERQRDDCPVKKKVTLEGKAFAAMAFLLVLGILLYLFL